MTHKLIKLQIQISLRFYLFEIVFRRILTNEAWNFTWFSHFLWLSLFLESLYFGKFRDEAFLNSFYFIISAVFSRLLWWFDLTSSMLTAFFNWIGVKINLRFSSCVNPSQYYNKKLNKFQRKIVKTTLN